MVENRGFWKSIVHAADPPRSAGDATVKKKEVSRGVADAYTDDAAHRGPAVKGP